MELRRPLATVTPTLDGDVLAVLARQDLAFTTGQLHRILHRFSEEGIRKALHRLNDQGVVDSDRVGNAFTYRLNRDHLAAAHVIGLSGLAETLLKQLEASLENWSVPPTYAAMFGSAARGTMTTHSDLDILLIRPDSADEELWDAQVSELVQKVRRWTGNDTRALQFSVSELDGRAKDEPVLRDVLVDGVTIAGTRAWLAKKIGTQGS